MNQPSPEATNSRSVEPPRGEALMPRKKELGQDGYTEMSLRDIGEMVAHHAGHTRGECACVEILQRAMLAVVLRAQKEAEKGGMTAGREFRRLLRDVVEEL